MKSILIITSFLPYPIHSGGQQAQFNMIETLRKTCKIGIVFPINKDNRTKDVEGLSSLWPEVRLFPFPLSRQYSNIPFLLQKARKFLRRKFYSHSKNFQVEEALDHTDFLTSKGYLRFVNKAIAELNPDLIQVEFVQNLNIGRHLPKDKKKLFVHHEIGFVITDRMLKDMTLTSHQQKRKDQKKQKEISRLHQYDGIITLTDTDKEILLDAGVKVPVYVSPAAVNTKEMDFQGWNGTIVFLGGYGHHPNQEGMDWFLNEVTPCVDWKEYPYSELEIVGAEWPSTYEKDYNGLKVRTVGYVDDLSDYVAKGIMIIPLLTGSGMRMKILDAAALSVPFVATSVGAEGLDFKNGHSCMIADSASDFAHALEKIMIDEQLMATLAKNAHQLYKDNYSLEKLVERRRNIYKELC